MEKCIECGNIITNPRKNKVYCGNACKQKAYRNVISSGISDSSVSVTDINPQIRIFEPEFVSEIVLETLNEMKQCFKTDEPFFLDVFIYYKLKWNVRGKDFVSLMKWYGGPEESFVWFYKCGLQHDHYGKPTKDEKIEFDMYCQFLKAFRAYYRNDTETNS